MGNQHQFNVELDWKSLNTSETSSHRTYTKNHVINIEGKESLAVSAAKGFKGDPSLYNPEDLLLSALTSCHMMSYLYCCAQANIEVLAYSDSAQATLEVYPDGSGKIVKVVLRPIVQLADISQAEEALQLHRTANQLCFIANSCNFVVEHHAEIKM